MRWKSKLMVRAKRPITSLFLPRWIPIYQEHLLRISLSIALAQTSKWWDTEATSSKRRFHLKQIIERLLYHLRNSSLHNLLQLRAILIKKMQNPWEYNYNHLRHNSMTKRQTTLLLLRKSHDLKRQYKTMNRQILNWYKNWDTSKLKQSNLKTKLRKWQNVSTQ